MQFRDQVVRPERGGAAGRAEKDRVYPPERLVSATGAEFSCTQGCQPPCNVSGTRRVPLAGAREYRAGGTRRVPDTLKLHAGTRAMPKVYSVLQIPSRNERVLSTTS